MTYTWTVDIDDPEFAACPTASIDLDCNPAQRCYLPGDVHLTVDVDDPNSPHARRHRSTWIATFRHHRGQAIADAGTVTDACGTVDVTAVADAPATNTAGCKWTQTWTVTATDACGNDATCQVT
ncbi:MAG: hypothetical protein IPK76_19580 [Lewinellaceae bacterium]|nr:hypothetical protein [Lewinellaceae bacterium]